MPAIAAEALARAQREPVALLDAWEADDPLEQRESMAELRRALGPERSMIPAARSRPCSALSAAVPGSRPNSFVSCVAKGRVYPRFRNLMTLVRIASGSGLVSGTASNTRTGGGPASS